MSSLNWWFHVIDILGDEMYLSCMGATEQPCRVYISDCIEYYGTRGIGDPVSISQDEVEFLG